MTNGWFGSKSLLSGVALSLLLAAGCVSDGSKSAASSTPAVAEGLAASDGATPGVPPPGFGFVYILDHAAGTPPMHNCFVRFLNGSGKTTVEALLTPDSDRVLVKVPPGAYRLAEAHCDNGRRFTLPKLPRFPVEVDKVTYLGELKLVQSMAGKKRELDTLLVDVGIKENTQEGYADFQRRGLTLLWWKPDARR